MFAAWRSTPRQSFWHTLTSARQSLIDRSVVNWLNFHLFASEAELVETTSGDLMINIHWYGAGKNEGYIPGIVFVFSEGDLYDYTLWEFELKYTKVG